jgi:hypothetical protein
MCKLYGGFFDNNLSNSLIF